MILDSVADLLPGLIPGQFRGVAFDVPDTRTEFGRRVAEHLFPGRDDAEYDDLGALPEVVSVEGVIVGDDYVPRIGNAEPATNPADAVETDAA